MKNFPIISSSEKYMPPFGTFGRACSNSQHVESPEAVVDRFSLQVNSQTFGFLPPVALYIATRNHPRQVDRVARRSNTSHMYPRRILVRERMFDDKARRHDNGRA